MVDKVYGRNGQHNRIVGEGEKHEHYFYDSKTGIMGWHGSEASPEINKWAGQRAQEKLAKK